MKLAAAAVCALLGQSARFKSKGGAESVSIAGFSVHNYKPDNKEWIVMFKKGTDDSAIERICNGNCRFQGHPSKKGFAFAKVQGSEKVVEEMLAGHPFEVDFIESDDTDYAIPEIENHAASLGSWGLERIGAGSRPTTGKGVHIYVQDTGIRASHGDFGGRAAGAYDMTTGNEDGVECGSGPCALDAQGHGTHCAGTAAGTTFGVAPDALVYAVKTLSDQGSGSRAWQYAGIDWVASNGYKPTVLSMSLGGSGRDPGYDAAFEAAMEAGVTAVLAAGNSNSDTCNFSPAFSSNAITVGATDSNNKRASYSNYGSCNDIMAPGSAIVSASNAGDTGSRALSGTSMACPHVSGAAALLLEANPSLTKDDILAELKSKAIQNYISGIMFEDPNYFLWVSSEAAVSPAPTPAPPAPVRCPAWSAYREPDRDGDCKCDAGKKCSVSGGSSWDCPSSGGPGGWGGRYFTAGCEQCKCYMF